MRQVALVAGNILSPFGDLSATWQALLAGESALRRQRLHPVAPVYPLAILPGLPGRGGSRQRLEALLSRLLADLPPLPPETALVVATTKGAVDELLRPEADQAGQAWNLAGQLQSDLGLCGPLATISAACASGTLAILHGAMAIASGTCDQALVVGVDLVGAFILAGFDSLKALSPGGARPFDRMRDGLSLGDGGGWLLLASPRQPALAGREPLALLAGWGVSCDASHITAPCRQGSGLRRALAQLRAGTTLPLGGVNAHGTGTVYNDAMEMLALRQEYPAELPFCSVKGALGHSLGAAGVIEALLSVRSLGEGCLPPTVGLLAPDGEGVVSGREPLPLLAPTIVSCNSGFGGINAALLFSRPEVGR
jgi:3-oxoacyl-(acyl-carrier-protein) synthase